MEVETLGRNTGVPMEERRSYRGDARGDRCVRAEHAGREGTCVQDGESLTPDVTDGGTVGPEHQSFPLERAISVFRVRCPCPALEQVHDFVEIRYVYRGSCGMRVSERELALREGQALLIDSGCHHLTGSVGEDDVVVGISVARRLFKDSLEALRLSQDWLTGFRASALDEQVNRHGYTLFRSEENRRVRFLVQKLARECLDPTSDVQRMLKGSFRLLLVDLLKECELDADERGHDVFGRGVSAVSIIGHIQENYHTCTLESVAGHFFVSPNYVSRILKQATSRTYQQLVQEMRLSHAASLIRKGGCTVQEAARAAGYTNMSFFYHKFREAYGVTPAAYRKHSAP